MTALLELHRRMTNALRAIIGVPDYDRYLAHMHSAHPDAAPLAREDFWRRCQEDRYSRPGSRCC